MRERLYFYIESCQEIAECYKKSVPARLNKYEQWLEMAKDAKNILTRLENFDKTNARQIEQFLTQNKEL